MRKDHPLRAIRAMVDEVLKQLSPRFDTMYAKVGRPSIPPEQLLSAQLLQLLYSVRSERLLMEEIDYNLLFRWFVGLNADDEVWDATVFTKNRDRLLEAEVAKKFLAQVVAQAGANGLTSDERFTVEENLLVEHRHGLIVSSTVWEATDTAERLAALAMLERVPGVGRVTVGGGKGFDTAEFVRECRNMHVTPHVAQNLAGRRSAIDGRTTRQAGYQISQKKRKRIEECFGWWKTIALLRKLRHRGTLKVDWIFALACAAYNLVRMRNLLAAPVAVG